MKRISNIYVWLVLMGCTCPGLAQRPPSCNQAVLLQEYKSKLIKEICIPPNYVITRLYTDLRDIDIDGDGLGDFIFDWRKLKLTEGDTTYITAYRMNADSTYSFLRTFDNLFPIHLDSYDYGSKKPALKKIFECYAYGYPLIDLEFEAGVIAMELRIDAASGYTLKYRYDPKRNNWFLFYFKEWIDMPGEGRQYTDKEMPEQPESIDDFSYQKYLCPELYPDK